MPKPLPMPYATHLLDGMPTCRHCRRQFKRHEALKKHLRRACPVLHGRKAMVTDTTPSRKVLLASGEFSQGPEGRTPLIAATPEPLFQDPADFQQMLRQNWKRPLHCAQFARDMSQYCVFCRQWISMVGPGAKQHIRLAHPQHWMHKQAAVARCRTLGLTYGSPCAYCSLQVRDPRAHVPRCSVVFQASLAGLVLCQDHDAAGRPNGGGTGETVSSGVCRSLRKIRSHGRACFGPLQALQARAQGTLSGERSRSWVESVAAEPEMGGGRLSPRPEHAGSVTYHDQADASSRGRAGAAQTLNDVDGLHGHAGGGSARHPAADSCQMAGEVRCTASGHQSEGFHVHGPGQGSEQKTRGDDPERGSAGQGIGRELPSCRELSELGLPAVEPHHAHSGTCQSAAAQPPGCHSSPRHAAAAGLPSGSGDGLQGAARSTGSTHRRGRTVYDLLKLGPEVPDGQGPRAPISGPAVHGLDRSGGDLGTARALLEDGVEVGTSAGQDCAITTYALPTARLQNRSNLCCLNSAAQALAWLGSIANASALCYGRARHALQIVLSSDRAYLPDCIPWTQFLRGWDGLHRQQDVCEFLCHFLERAQPAAFCGRWEARLVNPHVCVESGSLLSPLPLEVAGGTISAVIQNWHRQHAVFALESSAGILLLQLKRYNLEAGAARKNMTRIACRPGELVRVPHFRGSQGLEVAMLPYRVAFVIFHLGASTSSGQGWGACCVGVLHL